MLGEVDDFLGGGDVQDVDALAQLRGQPHQTLGGLHR